MRLKALYGGDETTPHIIYRHRKFSKTSSIALGFSEHCIVQCMSDTTIYIRKHSSMKWNVTRKKIINSLRFELCSDLNYQASTWTCKYVVQIELIRIEVKNFSNNVLRMCSSNRMTEKMVHIEREKKSFQGRRKKSAHEMWYMSSVSTRMRVV